MSRLSALLAAALAALPASGVAAAEPGRVTVVGRATIELPPDYAAVQIGVANRGPNPAAALDANSAAAARVIAIAREFGVAPADLGTSSVNLAQAFRQVRDPSGGSSQQPDGYRAENNVQVRLRDLGRLGELMRKALDGGANAIGGVTFGLTDPAAVEVRAGQEAVRDATARATALAEAARAKLGPVEAIATPPRSGAGFGGAAVMRRALAAPPPPSVPLAAGAIEVSAEVEMTWTLVQP